MSYNSHPDDLNDEKSDETAKPEPITKKPQIKADMDS